MTKGDAATLVITYESAVTLTGAGYCEGIDVEVDIDSGSAISYVYNIVSTGVWTWSGSTPNGTGNNQAQLQWSDERTVAAGVDDDLDIAGGLTNVAGEATAFAKVKLIHIENRNTTGTNVLHIKPGPSSGFDTWIGGTDPYIILRGGFLNGTNPGGSINLIALDSVGYEVGSGTGDILTVTNPGASSILYRIILIGT